MNMKNLFHSYCTSNISGGVDLFLLVVAMSSRSDDGDFLLFLFLMVVIFLVSVIYFL